MTTGTSFRPIPTHRPAARAELMRPEPGQGVAPESPALAVMTDFERTPPVSIGADASLAAVNDTMLAHRVRLLFVTSDDGLLLGIVTTQDTLGERPMQLAQRGKGSVAELTASDLMHPLATLQVLSLADVRHANVGDLVATLKRLGRQHVLVSTSQSTGTLARICGLFSTTQIGRQLGTEVQTFEVAQSFAQIEAALAG